MTIKPKILYQFYPIYNLNMFFAAVKFDKKAYCGWVYKNKYYSDQVYDFLYMYIAGGEL